MARFANGYIKFYRRTVEEDIGHHGVRLAVWVTLLVWANRFDTQIYCKGTTRKLPPGTVVTAIRELAKKLHFSKDAVARALRALAARGSIRIETTPRGTIT